MSKHRSVRFSATARVSTLLLLCGAMVISSHAQTFTSLFTLTTPTGVDPLSPLVQGLDGNLYGTAARGGTGIGGDGGGGTFYRITPSGTFTKLYDFCATADYCPDGSWPGGLVALGPDGSFYGVTFGDGRGLEHSTVYKMTPLGSLTTLHTFCTATNCVDGSNAISGLTLAWNGNFYGISSGPNNTPYPDFNNAVFRISPSGHLTPLLTVCPNLSCPADAGPSAALLQASGGYLIGPGPGGANGAGAIYRMTPSGTPSIIYSFCPDATCHDGELGAVTGPLVQTPSGTLVGTDFAGGDGANCPSGQSCGTAFRISGGGTLTKLHDFCAWAKCQDGSVPNALILASDGNFYGTAGGGGSNYGTVFKLTPSGKYSVIHTFDAAEGGRTDIALLQATDGNFYGATSGGAFGGAIFRISLGLPAFVKTVQPAGKVGDSITILGYGLTGSTSVTFNGAAATFTVVSDTQITATVPSGASTGKVQITTPSGKLATVVTFPIHS
jgi:uncharacterized repeat protein (TIGR03803 family)